MQAFLVDAFLCAFRLLQSSHQGVQAAVILAKEMVRVLLESSTEVGP